LAQDLPEETRKLREQTKLLLSDQKTLLLKEIKNLIDSIKLDFNKQLDLIRASNNSPKKLGSSRSNDTPLKKGKTPLSNL